MSSIFQNENPEKIGTKVRINTKVNVKEKDSINSGVILLTDKNNSINKDPQKEVQSELSKLFNTSSKSGSKTSSNKIEHKQDIEVIIRKQQKCLPKETSKEGKLRMLMRFTCGKCQRRYSKIQIPDEFSKQCEKCYSLSNLVVLRCDSTNLFGGYLCLKCEHRFLQKISITEFKKVTPFCFYCDKNTTIYQVLLNRSKLSIKNQKIYQCEKCKKKANISYYQPYGINNKNHLIPICCENRRMAYTQLERSFVYHSLDAKGRSSQYSSIMTPSSYHDNFYYEENKMALFNKILDEIKLNKK